MPVKLHIELDKGGVKDIAQRVALNLPRIANAYARKMAEFIKSEAVVRAPHDTGELRESAQVVQDGQAKYEVVFSRVNHSPSSQSHYPPEGFDVAVWTHEADYIPSDPSPGVGNRYLARAVEENEGVLDGIETELVNEIAGMFEE